MKRSVVIPDDLAEWLSSEAVRRDRSVNYIVVQAVRALRDAVEAVPAPSGASRRQVSPVPGKGVF